MLLRSGFNYQYPAVTATTTSSSFTSNRRGRKRKSMDDELDERSPKKHQQQPSSSSHPALPVATPSPSNPPVLSSSPAPVSNERGPRRVRFSNDVVTYLFEVDNEPCRAADHSYVDFLPWW
ncbi:hypothetical protein PS15m_010536 [Mucor circinelloides]